MIGDKRKEVEAKLPLLTIDAKTAITEILQLMFDNRYFDTIGFYYVKGELRNTWSDFQLREMIEILLSEELIEYVDGSKDAYHITKKGCYEYLAHFTKRVKFYE